MTLCGKTNTQVFLKGEAPIRFWSWPEFYDQILSKVTITQCKFSPEVWAKAIRPDKILYPTQRKVLDEIVPTLDPSVITIDAFALQLQAYSKGQFSLQFYHWLPKWIDHAENRKDLSALELGGRAEYAVDDDGGMTKAYRYVFGHELFARFYAKTLPVSLVDVAKEETKEDSSSSKKKKKKKGKKSAVKEDCIPVESADSYGVDSEDYVASSSSSSGSAESTKSVAPKFKTKKRKEM